MIGFVAINELVDFLRKNDLIITDKSDSESSQFVTQDFLIKQQELLNAPAVKTQDIVRFKLLHYKTVNGVKSSPLFKPGEIYKDSKGITMVCTEAVKRIRRKKFIQ